jgi:hypothetical protein
MPKVTTKEWQKRKLKPPGYYGYAELKAPKTVVV